MSQDSFTRGRSTPLARSVVCSECGNKHYFYGQRPTKKVCRGSVEIPHRSVLMK